MHGNGPVLIFNLGVFCSYIGSITSSFALNGYHSPEGQLLHAHRGDQLCQHHPIEDKQERRSACVSVWKYHS